MNQLLLFYITVYEVSIIVVILQNGYLKLTGVKQFSQIYRAGKGQTAAWLQILRFSHYTRLLNSIDDLSGCGLMTLILQRLSSENQPWKVSWVVLEATLNFGAWQWWISVMGCGLPTLK